MSNPIQEKPRSLQILSYSLTTILWLVAAFTVIGLVAWAVVVKARGEQVQSAELLMMIGLLVDTLIAVGLVIALLAIARQFAGLLDRTEAIENRTAVLAEQQVARSRAEVAAPVHSGMDLKEVREALQELRETLLLPEAERARRFAILVEREVKKRLESVERHVLGGEFHHAREELQRLAERFGEDDRVIKARASLDAAAEAARNHDLTMAQSRVQELMAASRWDQAERVAHELAMKYPEGAEVMGLLGLVRRERKLFEHRNRHRMHEEIQQFVHQRRWKEAFEAAQRFIATFPTGSDTDALRDQLATLLANADVQARKDVENRFKELIEQKQYWDALELARRIIQEHPSSPQANALRSQLARLEELAHQQSTRT